MGAVTWSTPGTLTTYLSTELNSLASLGNKIGAALDNSSNLLMLADVEVVLASFTPGTAPYVNVWAVQALDATNYEDGGDSVDPPGGAEKYSRGVTTGASAKRIVIPRIVIPPGSFKLILGNRTGAAWPASGNTMKYRLYGTTVA